MSLDLPRSIDNADVLLDALTVGAHDRHELAAVRVLAAGSFLSRGDFQDLAIIVDHLRCRVLWRRVHDCLTFSSIPLSGDERRLLCIALSLTGRHAVDLSEVLGRLDPGLAPAVLGALATAIPSTEETP